MRIAVVQCGVVYGEPLQNLEFLERTVRDLRAESVDLAVFPEAFLTGYCCDSKEEAQRIAVPTAFDTRTDVDYELGRNRPGGEIWDRIDALVGSTGIGLVVGYASKHEGLISNAASMWIPGRPSVTYRKTHLPHLGLDRFARPGSFLPVFDTPWGKVGILICFDMRFPEPARVLALEGAELIVVPTNWPRTQAADIYPIVRSSENRVFLAACNRTGTENGTKFIGRSGIYDPLGDTLAKAGEEDETLIVDIDLSVAQMKRNVIIPGEYELDLWGCRQPDLYGPISHT